MRPHRALHLAVILLGLTLAAMSASAATILIVNKDSPGEGFNDPTNVPPIGGNPGTTRGQQRLNVFNQAAAVWGSILPSAVTIKVDSNFDPLTCTSTSAVLGSTFANGAVRDFPGAEWPGTWYVIALADRQSGSDQNGITSDMTAQFNSSVDNSTCLGTIAWYYGLDHQHDLNVDLLATVLHELGHGLGFTSLVDLTTGQYAGYNPNPALSDPHTDAFTRFLYDDTQAKFWDQLTPAQRVTSSTNTNNLVWRGLVTGQHAKDYLGPLQLVRFGGSTSFQGDKDFGTADFGPPLSSPPVIAEIVLVNDGVGATSDGCTSPFTNAAALNGKIALIDRGNCDFVVKAKAAQDNGAVAVIIANNTTGIVFMAGTDPSITIPTVSISQADGVSLKSALNSGTVWALIGTEPPALQGADVNGYVKMYAPASLEQGSSVSHFDTSAFPDLLMEPSITPNLTSSVDLTRYAFEDMGWFLPRPPLSVGGPLATSSLSLEIGAPNPFRVKTLIHYSLTKPGMTEMGVYDISGRLVKRLMSSWTPAGSASIIWDATDSNGARVPSGVYLYRIRQNGQTQSQRIVVTD